eukprot:10952362-Prorocentrum_lima.AAC.1
MTSSLVGSEMCIRDSHETAHAYFDNMEPRTDTEPHDAELNDDEKYPVSYTHLTLPTICSV